MHKLSYIGECQICGRTQKLPNGLVAKHGYKVDPHSGQFMGVCAGSDNKPYEESCDLICVTIELLKSGIEFSKSQIKEIDASMTDPVEHNSVKIQRPFYIGKHRHITIVDGTVEENNGKYYLVSKDGEYSCRVNAMFKSKPDVVKHFLELHKTYINNAIHGREKEISFLIKRKDSWVKKDVKLYLV